MNRLYINKDWSTLKKLLALKAAGGGSVPQTGTETGSLVTFETTKSANLKALSAEIEPVQDLHGYDNPWPAGGGRNKFNPEEAQDNRWIDTSTGAIEPCNGYWTTGFIPVKAGDVIRCEAKGSSRNAWYNADKSDATYFAFSGGNTSVTAPADGFVVFTVFSNTISFGADFIVTVNDSDITFAPYSNICPISGWTEVKVYRSGADTSDPTEYTVTIPSDPGTVYGGTLDVVSGVLTVTHVMVDLGTLTWTANGSGDTKFFQTTAFDVKPSTTNAICSQYKYSAIATENTSQGFNINGERCRLRDAAFVDSTAAEFKTAISGVQLVYELATPTTYNLTPTQIKTLVGTNNVWSDAGDVTVTYYK